MNPFNVVFVLAISVFIATGIFAVLAPGFGVSLPVSPTLPTLALTNSTDWLTQAGQVLYFVGQIIWFFFSYVGYMISITGVVFSIATLGIFPPLVGTLAGVVLMVLLIGSVLLFIRGYSGSGGGK